MTDNDKSVLNAAVQLTAAVMQNPDFNKQFAKTLTRRTGEEDPVLMFTRYYFNHLKGL